MFKVVGFVEKFPGARVEYPNNPERWNATQDFWHGSFPLLGEAIASAQSLVNLDKDVIKVEVSNDSGFVVGTATKDISARKAARRSLRR